MRRSLEQSKVPTDTKRHEPANHDGNTKGGPEPVEDKQQIHGHRNSDTYGHSIELWHGTHSCPRSLLLRLRTGDFVIEHFGLCFIAFGIACIALPCFVHMRIASASAAEILAALLTDPQKIQAAPGWHANDGYQVWIVGLIFWGWVLAWWGTMCCLNETFQIPLALDILGVVPLFAPLAVMVFLWPSSLVRTVLIVTYTLGLGSMMLAGVIGSRY